MSFICVDCSRCTATIEKPLGTLRCIFKTDHDGRHFGGSETWEDPPKWLFAAGIEEGRLDYDSETEEWRLNGSVEGRMAPPLAQAMITLLTRGLDAIKNDEDCARMPRKEQP